MRFNINALLNPWLIFCAWLFLWAARLRLIADYYQRTFELGYYPAEADTIAIPIASNGVMTILLAPVFALVLWLLIRRSIAERRRWFAWNRKRWILSLTWTLLFSAFALLILPGLAEDIRIRLPLNAIADVGWFLFWLAIRALVVSRISSEEKPQSPAQPFESTITVPSS
jgi:hypothetical protein